jgi:hypothetical protein
LTLTLDRPRQLVSDDSWAPPPAAPALSTRLLGLAGLASLAAGTIHAAAIAAHSDHRQAVWAFTAVAVAQLAWGAAALARPRRWLAALGVALAAGAVAGWALAKSSGISFIDGLDDKEPVRFSDALAAGLAVAALAGAALALLARRRVFPKLLTGAAAAAIVAVAAPGTVSAVDHPHDDGHTLPDGTVQVAAVVPPRPYDPNLPIDLGGVPGVTPEQQARAENLLSSTVLLLPRWQDPEYALANGFFSIGDGVTGTEHFLNREFMDDDVMLDPTRPESLVYDVDTATGERTLSAAMYMTTPGTTLADVPDIGGALTQWHIHNNLCFNAQGQVGGLVSAEGGCDNGLVRGEERPMIHVWIRRHPCGPFAALEGIGGGQIAEGETVNCDELHGS